ncbi:tRNA guanosine(34) transglycosylase Tgt [Myxococcota bacterium]|nr:tRNA guanosine(34) transglycosylase Tgt [Myxococcota bacterium]MBU1380375.1 tRNA guanosine(34) transglycosylase Tgt [Myxococcota bacterium]MBU1495643.1 tRNA guanosine(34) transglycosylase Tgt [Myxococcota bacterium]
MTRLNFKLEATSPHTSARATTFKTLHSTVKTPIFMPVGTRAAVRGATFRELSDAGSEILLANTYHLFLRPGAEIFRKAGGIHRFMNWGGSVLTDSGGFQIFSLSNSRKITEEGAEFRSYIDGKKVFLSPEASIEMQKAIASDIMMVLDQCVPSTSDRNSAAVAMELTHRWAARSLSARGDSNQAMFGIVQGACHEDLRKISAEVLSSMPFDGFAIGGLAVGETKDERDHFTGFTAALLPRDLPRYLMGVGTPSDILEAVHRGVDMFDCIIPTQLAHQSFAYTRRGQLRLERTVYREDFRPLDNNCPCPACRNHTRAYIHHLFKSSEHLGIELLAVHNLYFYHNLMREMRSHIINGTFYEFYQQNKETIKRRDEENPMIPTRTKRRKTPPARLGDYEIQRATSGYCSIKHISSGETMHSVNNPDEEAREIYVNQAALFSTGVDTVIWDVGMGAAHNAMAAIRAIEEMPQHPGQFKIISFEKDLDSLRLALLNPSDFPHIRHCAPHAIIKEGKWISKNIEWVLKQGDFMEQAINESAPNIVFHDPFSSKTDTQMWSVDCFRLILEKAGDQQLRLFTYSNSTAVRTAMLLAGFFAAQGISTGPKSDTTIAFNKAYLGSGPCPYPLLDTKWLHRWEKSTAKLPPLCTQSTESVEESLKRHPQFVNNLKSNL